MILTLLKELSLVISHYLESHDLITIQNNFDLNVLLINYTNSQTNELTDILDYNLNKMLKDNHLAAENPVKILIQNLVE